MVDWGRQASRRRDKETAFAAERESQAQVRSTDFQEVHAALLQLAPDLRETVALVFFEEMNHREAAEALGCAETTISWRIFRAKGALKKLLSQRKGETP